MSAASHRGGPLSAVPRVAAVLLIAAGVASPAPVDLPADGAIVYPSAVGEVTFPHSLHADELGFECVECHHETAAAELRTPHEEYFEELWVECARCHRQAAPAAVPQSCGECHHASPTTTADETLSAKVVVHRSCWNCHEVGTGEEASRGCSFCHSVAATLEEVSR